MRRPTGDEEVAGSTPAEVGNILSWRLRLLIDKMHFVLEYENPYLITCGNLRQNISFFFFMNTLNTNVILFYNAPSRAAENQNIQIHSNKDIFWLQSRLLKTALFNVL